LLAIDSASNLYGTTNKLYPPAQDSNAFVKIDPTTAKCTFIHWDSNPNTTQPYPTDMKFFPADMVEPGKETLVGMNSGEYVKIDPATGAQATLGVFSGQGEQTTYLAEWGIAALGGKAYARVSTSGGGGYYLAQFNPSGPNVGKLVKLVDNLTLPDTAVSFVRLGTFIYAFGSTGGSGSSNTAFKIDIAGATVTALPALPNTGTYGVSSAAAAPNAP
jgi:hypothetical protein